MKLNSIMKPKQIVFESRLDVVKYTAGGILPPKKADFNAVMGALDRQPEMHSTGNGDWDGDKLEITAYTPSGTEIVIADCMTPELPALKEYMQEVYKYRCRNRNILLTVAGVAVVGLIISKVRHSHHDNLDNGTEGMCTNLEVPEDMK